MGIKGNIVKGWVTSIIGTATMIVALVLVFTKAIDFIWEGIAGLSIGAILLMAPVTIETIVVQLAKKWGTQLSNTGPDTYNKNTNIEDKGQGNQKTA